MRKILSVFFIVYFLLFLTACNLYDPFRSVVSGDFVYSKVGVSDPEHNVAIIGLSDEGKMKETIVFPTTIDGYIVSEIGTQLIKRPSGSIVFTNAKNIYFPAINFRTYNEFQYDDNASLNIYVGGYKRPEMKIFSGVVNITNSKIYVHQLFLEEEHKLGRDGNYNYIIANTVYYLSDDLNDVFFIDDADGTTVNVVPPNPYKEGYEFVGWYKDLDGIEPWDFENDLVPEKIYDIDGNYIFVETKIYAIWR